MPPRASRARRAGYGVAVRRDFAQESTRNGVTPTHRQAASRTPAPGNPRQLFRPASPAPRAAIMCAASAAQSAVSSQAATSSTSTTPDANAVIVDAVNTHRQFHRVTTSRTLTALLAEITGWAASPVFFAAAFAGAALNTRGAASSFASVDGKPFSGRPPGASAREWLRKLAHFGDQRDQRSGDRDRRIRRHQFIVETRSACSVGTIW